MRIKLTSQHIYAIKLGEERQCRFAPGTFVRVCDRSETRRHRPVSADETDARLSTVRVRIADETFVKKYGDQLINNITYMYRKPSEREFDAFVTPETDATDSTESGI